MNLDAKQRILLAFSSFLFKVLFPYDVRTTEAWAELERAIREQAK